MSYVAHTNFSVPHSMALNRLLKLFYRQSAGVEDTLLHAEGGQRFGDSTMHTTEGV